MKTIVILILTLLALVLPAAAATTNRLFLTFDFSVDYDSNITFYIFGQANPAIPVAQWAYVTNVDFVTFTNAAKPGEYGRVEIPAATDVRQFYVVTASNFTGMSDFSESVSVRRLLPGTGLKVGALIP